MWGEHQFELEAARHDLAAIDQARRRPLFEVDLIRHGRFEVGEVGGQPLLPGRGPNADVETATSLGLEIRIADDRVPERVEARQLEALAPAAVELDRNPGQTVRGPDARHHLCVDALLVREVDAQTRFGNEAEVRFEVQIRKGAANDALEFEGVGKHEAAAEVEHAAAFAILVDRRLRRARGRTRRRDPSCRARETRSARVRPWWLRPAGQTGRESPEQRRGTCGLPCVGSNCRSAHS